MKLSEIVDIDELRGICEDFTALTGAVMAILDLDGKILIATGWQDICVRFHRVNAITSARCRESDTTLAGNLAKGMEYNVYKCRNGMVDVAAPIIVEGEHVANFFTGQFFFEEPDKAYFIRQAREMGFNPASYLEALSRAPVFSLDHVKSMMSFFNRLVRLIGKMGSAEEAKEKERAHLRALLDALPDMVWLKDVNGAFRTCNPMMERLLGAAESDIIGKTDYDFASKEVADAYRLNDSRAVAADSPSVNEEWVTFALGGRQMLVETTKAPVRDARGDVIGVLGIARDITERKRAEEQLANQALRFKTVLDAARDGVHILDASGNIVEASDSFYRMLGYTKDEAIGMNVVEWDMELSPADLDQTLQRLLCGQEASLFETRHRRRDGSAFDVEIGYFPLRMDGKQVLFCSSRDITERKRYQQQLEHIAHHDILTNLPNRALLEDRLRQGIALSQRRGTSLAVVYLDLDFFKEINDAHTHNVGDQLLVTVSQRLKAVLREGDTLARIGGDEFVVILTDLEKSEDCHPLLDRMLLAAASPVVIDEKILKVSASIGATVYPRDEVDADMLLRHADQAMYQAKQEGKNRYHMFDTDHNSVVKARHDSIERIKLALKQQEFVLYYQPKVNMRTGEVIGVEALIRWQHPTLGLLPPSTFLPVVEGHHLNVDIGEWVIDTALWQITEWSRAGLHMPVSVNVSARQLLQDDFVQNLRILLASHPRVGSPFLELEILETSALADLGMITELMRSCQRIGVRFALDDFGTGYSALTYLKRLPAEILKIDQTFVRDMLEDQDDLAIVKGIIGLAQAFRREVIAEGVETAAVGEMLLSLGCDLAQGYGIARPMPGQAIPGWVKTWRPYAAWSQQPQHGNLLEVAIRAPS